MRRRLDGRYQRRRRVLLLRRCRRWWRRQLRDGGVATIQMVDDEIRTLFACRGANRGTSETWQSVTRTITGGDHARSNNGRLERARLDNSRFDVDDDNNGATEIRRSTQPSKKHGVRLTTHHEGVAKMASKRRTRYTHGPFDCSVSKTQTFVAVGDVAGAHGLREALSSGPVAVRRIKKGGKFKQNVS